MLSAEVQESRSIFFALNQDSFTLKIGLEFQIAAVLILENSFRFIRRKTLRQITPGLAADICFSSGIRFMDKIKESLDDL